MDVSNPGAWFTPLGLSFLIFRTESAMPISSILIRGQNDCKCSAYLFDNNSSSYNHLHCMVIEILLHKKSIFILKHFEITSTLFCNETWNLHCCLQFMSILYSSVNVLLHYFSRFKWVGSCTACFVNSSLITSQLWTF